MFNIDIFVNLSLKVNTVVRLTCLTKIWHPNISAETGEVCEDFYTTEEQGVNIRQTLIQF